MDFSLFYFSLAILALRNPQNSLTKTPTICKMQYVMGVQEQLDLLVNKIPIQKFSRCCIFV